VAARARLPYLLLGLTCGGLLLGAALAAAGNARAAELLLGAVTVVGLAMAVWWGVAGLRRHRPGADIVAVLALASTLLTGELLAGAIVAVMLATGRVLEAWAEGRSKHALTALVGRVPRTASVVAPDGTVRTVGLAELGRGDQVLVRSGEVVPVDGTLLTPAVLDESALTGEAMPVDRAEGHAVRSGVVVSGQPVRLRATTTAQDSTYAGVVRLVEQAQAAGAPAVRVADRVAAWFVPLTVAVAGLAWLASGDVTRAVAVLVVATPCPLILAVPIALVGGMAQSARRGAVVKGGSALEQLALGSVVLFDKTGTLTAGRPEVAQLPTASGVAPQDVLTWAASLDQSSPHLLAEAVVSAALSAGLVLLPATDVTETGGRGITGVVAGRHVRVGKLGWPQGQPRPEWLLRAQRRAEIESALLVVVSVEDEPVGALLLVDPLRADAPRMIRALRLAGVDRLVLVTGDRAEVAETIAHSLDIDEVFAERLPDEKLAIVRNERARGPTIFVGDGVNDAPALAAADVGVALGARGATASSEAADVVLLVDRIDRLADAIVIARRSRRIAVQSAVLGMGMSLVAMGLAGVGLLLPVAGALLQEVIDVLAIASALRASRPLSIPVVRGEPAVMGRSLMSEHLALKPSLDQVRSVADALDDDDPRTGVRQVRRLHGWLTGSLLPHEAAEEEQLYPVMAKVLGGSDPTGAMSRAHVEIEHLVRRIGLVLQDLSGREPTGQDLTELRRLLYGLHAVLVLHFAQEEEGMFPLIDEVG
jgi:heavy metal translocating P-type ATPase